MTDKMRMLLDATGGIRDEYIEEAAEKLNRPVWIRFVTMAAVLMLVVGATMLLWPESQGDGPIPIFAIRVYAADGSVTVLDTAGETAQLASGTSELFPGREVYTMDIALEEYSGDPAALSSGTFHFWHNGVNLQPGESDDEVAIEWIRANTGEVTGYRITGWCEDGDYISIAIRDQNNRIIHRTDIAVDYRNGYQACVRIFYTYQTDLTTDELIDRVLSQDYTSHLLLASSPTAAYSALRELNGGFIELEERPDAASKLLERYVKQMENADIPEGAVYIMGNDHIAGLMLSQDVFWDQLTQEEKELFASYGVWRDFCGF